jgi:hypothetical protein
LFAIENRASKSPSVAAMSSSELPALFPCAAHQESAETSQMGLFEEHRATTARLGRGVTRSLRIANTGSQRHVASSPSAAARALGVQVDTAAVRRAQIRAGRAGRSRENSRPVRDPRRGHGRCPRRGRRVARPGGCQALPFSSTQDNRLNTATGDWAPNYSKNECKARQIMKGVSRKGTGEIHAILCCDLDFT